MTTAAAWIIDTDVDARTTLGRMAKLVRRALNDPRVIYASNQVIAAEVPRAYLAQIAALTEFLDCYFKFVPNPIGTQTIRPAGWTRNAQAPGMLEDIEARGFTQGACDDAAVLAATIGMANGMPARFRAIAFGDDDASSVGGVAPYSHVVADLLDDSSGAWYPVDVTRPDDAGADRPIARVLTFEVAQ